MLWQFLEHAPPLESSSWHGGLLPRAIAASERGDGAALMAILSRPGITAQNWRPLRFPVLAFVKWRRDPAVARALDRAFGLSPFYARIGG